MNILETIKQQKELQEKKELEKQERLNKFKTTTYEKLDTIDYSEVESYRPLVFRPIETDIVFTTKIVKDDRKSFKWFIWEKNPDNTLKKDQFLYRVVKKLDEKVFENGKVVSTVHEGKPSHIRLSENKIQTSKPNNYQTQFYPRNDEDYRVIFQGVDRFKGIEHYQKTGMLSMITPKINFWNGKAKDGTEFTLDNSDIGLPKTIYQTVKDMVATYSQIEFSKRDLVFYKDAKTSKNNVSHAKNEDMILKFPVINQLAIYGELTEFEKGLKPYDVSKYFQPTTIYWVKKYLSEFIKLVDKDLNTKFYQELLDLTSSKEKVDSNITDNSNVSPKTIEHQIVREDDDEPKLEDSNEFKTYFPKFNELSNVEKMNLIENLDSFENGNPKWKPYVKENDKGKQVWENGRRLIACSKQCETKFDLPNNIFKCPKCAKQL